MANNYFASIDWNREHQAFIDNRYSRSHTWTFDGGLQVPASSSPTMVPLPYSNAFNIDPEEALVAAVASSHMLWFLSLALRRGLCVDSYSDQACGFMAKNNLGQWAINRIHLRPKALFSGENQPGIAEIMLIHQTASKQCFIANSIKAEINCEPLIFSEVSSTY